MNNKFRKKYRSDSFRLQTWNYGWDAAYFITICTKNRECYFGDVVDGVMELSPVGMIANDLWYEIVDHAKHVQLGNFVVMPNHIHGIIILDGYDPGDSAGSDKHPVDPAIGVGTRHALSLRDIGDYRDPDQLPDDPSSKKSIGQQRFRNPGKNNISSIVGSYKSAVTKHCNRLDLDFAWQSRFQDHIIRNGESFDRISEYIRNNPSNWK